MSGLEIFGAVAAAATLLELAKRFSTRLEKHDSVHRDITALKKRIGVLAEIVSEISVVLNDIRRQQQDGQVLITAAEVIIWERMNAVLGLCTDKLKQLDSGLNHTLSRGSKSKLSAVPPEIGRRTKDLKAYVQALGMLKSLFQLIFQRQQTAAHQSMHRDIIGMRVFQEEKMDGILRGINQIQDQLQRTEHQKVEHRRVDSLQSGQILGNEADNLSLHLEKIVLAATSVKASFPVPNTESSSQLSVPPSSAESDVASFSTDNSPNITHVEPLQELAQRFKTQAEYDFEHLMYKDAEFHHLESMKCFKELHDAHGVSFDDFNNMNMTLSKIYRELKRYDDAKTIVQLAVKQPLAYDRELGWKSLLLDADENTDHRAQLSHEMAELLLAEFQTSSESSHLSVDSSKTDEVLLHDAEQNAKRAFRIRRNLYEKDHDCCKESARLLVHIYNNFTDKRMYAETYTDMYLVHDDRRNLSLPRLSGSVTSGSRSVRTSDHSDLAEAIKNHAISPDDVVSSATSADLEYTTDRESALVIAMDCPNFDKCHRCDILVDKLIRLGADRDAPFARAVRKDRITDCKLLLKHGANINRLDSSGLTPLMYAVKKGDINMVEFLLTEKPTINTCDFKGQTVLHLAAQTWNEDIFKLLLKTEGLEIDATDDNGMTAMHHAAKHDNLGFAKRLGRADADLEIKDKSNRQRTPLYIAIKEDKYLFVRVLLKLGAEVDLEYLPKTKSSDISNLLRSRKHRASGSSAAG